MAAVGGVSPVGRGGGERDGSHVLVAAIPVGGDRWTRGGDSGDGGEGRRCSRGRRG